MALSATVLRDAMRAALLADSANTKAVDNAALTAMCAAIASATVAHLVASGVINVVTACPAGAGTGTGTIT